MNEDDEFECERDGTICSRRIQGRLDAGLGAEVDRTIHLHGSLVGKGQHISIIKYNTGEDNG